MSLILDALKRAERERKLEQAPDLSAIYQEGHLNHHKSYSRFWMGGVLLAVFVALTFIFWPKEPSMDDPKDTSAAAMTASAPARESSPKDAPPPLPVAQKTVKKPAVPPPVPGGQDKQPNTVQKSDVPKNPTPKAPEKSKQPPVADKASTGTRKKRAVQPVREFVTPKGEKNPSTAAVEVVPAPPPKEAIPSIDALPKEIKALLEPLEINVHMYSPNPSERRVFINMHGYREGDAIGETGFRLTEITSNGVVINYGEGKVMLNVKKK